MPLYEYKKNAENIIAVSESCKKSIVLNTEGVIRTISNEITAGKKNIAIDGWYGVDFENFIAKLSEEFETQNITATFINTRFLFINDKQLENYKSKFVTDDPSFGFVNSEGELIDIMETEQVTCLQKKLAENKDQVLVVYHYGAAVEPLADKYDLIIYLDKTMQPLLWQMWEGKLIPFGSSEPDASYSWKEYYYCDFYLLFKHKKYINQVMDYYIEAIDPEDLKLIPRNSYDEIITETVKYPIKQVQIFQPGPWGAYRYKDLWEVAGLECNAWNKRSGPELSVLIDVGREKLINIPLFALMQYNEQMTGKYMATNSPDLFPLDIWLDDGYFPTPQPAERISMPIHNHPGTDYVKKHFNEPLGRYETYYIAEAYEGANTWMGFHDDADLEEFEAKCYDSNNLEPIENWKDYIAQWQSNVGDLYLIPPGTTHGHGGNQMVLEMDTSPSIAGTEYSFFQYDFARNSWDDKTKTMTGRPLKMHLEHAFDNEKWRRASYVKTHLRAQPNIVLWNKDFYMDRYTSLPEMPFEVERLHFYKQAEYSTYGKYLQIVTLTVGNKVTIQSKSDPSKQTQIDRLHCCAIPAGFGDYEIKNTDNSFCTCVVFRMKNG